MFDILSVLNGKWGDGTRPKDLYKQHVIKSPKIYVETITKGLTSTNKKVQNGSAEIASLLSEEHPYLLYPHIQLFIDNLDSKTPILRWEAVCSLGNLAKVDDNKVLPSVIPLMIPFLSNKSIVLQGHTIRALAKIAKQYPDNASHILTNLIESAEYFPGNRVGFLVEAMVYFTDNKDLNIKALNFVEQYIENDVKVVQRKARKVMKILQK
ncbi:HEAT repeat domain-containing protein [Thermoproteota archaeon]